MKYCLGTVQFGMDYGIQGNGQPIIDNVKIEFAYFNGIGTLDTAVIYGIFESVIGRVIRGKNLLKN